MASVRVIAKRAGVSITTVSRVLNNHPQVSEKVRRRVLAASNEVGYSHTIGRRSTNNIAFMYTGELSLGSPFDSALLEGMQQGMQEYAYDLMVLDARRSRLPNETYTQMFVRKGIRGAILRTTAQTRGVCKSVADERFPAVVVGDRFEDEQVNFVDCDSRDASREAIEHLIGLGHRKIALCIHVVDDSDHTDRLGGYRQAQLEHGIEFDDRMVFRTPATRDGGAQMLRRLITMPNRPTAVFITDPLPAVGALAEARKMGIAIPQDLSILGFDDAELRFTVVPEMSAVCQDAAALGREAFMALNSILDRDADGPPVRKALRTWLEIHESTGPAAPQLAPAQLAQDGELRSA